ncbi:MAG TPA: polymer-forming cytoskeletal protein [Polyangiaceae bacterium]|nr:polymer-forming cytoskeletal protein [Polyangiaceae bacterium]
MIQRSPLAWLLGILALLTSLSMAPSDARAAMQRSGEWPADERVSLSLRAVPRAQALRVLAERSGWSLVAADPGGAPVDVHVTDQPAAKVLELLLADGQFLVERDGKLVSVRKEPAPSSLAPLATSPSSPADSPSNGSPSTGGASNGSPPSALPGVTSLVRPTPKEQPPHHMGDSLFIGEGQLSRLGVGQKAEDVIVWRGTVIIEGEVTGSVLVLGGTARLTGTASVGEDVVAFGGALDLADGVQVEGDVASVFGSMERGPHVRVHCSTCEKDARNVEPSYLERLARNLAETSVAWIFGALLVAFAQRPLGRVREELTQRPWKALALGFGSLLVAAVALVTLLVTIIGIPLAVLSGLALVVAGYAGFCAALYTLGALVLRRPEANPYLQLAIGCCLVFVARMVPGLGEFACLLIGVAAFGALVTTRGGGLLGGKAPGGKTPS